VRANVPDRRATVALTTRRLPDERGQPGPISVAVLLRSRGFQEVVTPRAARLVQDHMRDLHLDLGQLEYLVDILGARGAKLLLPTGVRHDFDALCGLQQGLATPGMSRRRS
jgi:hypothetical protein